MHLPEAIAALIDAAAAKHSVRPELARAVAWVESRGSATAVSPAGAVGVMQLMPATSQALGVKDPTDPAQNIDAGVGYLAQLIKRFGSERKGLAAYNWGQGRVASGRALPAQVRGYVDRVLLLADTKLPTAPVPLIAERFPRPIDARDVARESDDPHDPGPVPEGAPSPFELEAARSGQPSRSQELSQLPGSLLLTADDVSDLRFALRLVHAMRGGFGELREDFRRWLDSADVAELVRAARRVVDTLQSELDAREPATRVEGDGSATPHN